MAVRKTNVLLMVCVLALAVTCALSVTQPLRFRHQLQERETVVKEHLRHIRTAQERFLQAKGHYAPSLDSLVSQGYLKADLRYIPFSGKRLFHLRTTISQTHSGHPLPLMECTANYQEYLQGLAPDAIQELVNEAASRGQYPGLKIGDLTTPNNNAGNWE